VKLGGFVKVVAWVQAIFSRHPYTFTVIISLLYLILFQASFMTSGDIWAESFYEYVYGAVIAGWSGFFHTGIAGYFNFLPKLLSFSYLLLGFPADQVDYFMRISTVLFAIACTSFIAHPYNRYLIKSDVIRSALSLLVLMTLYHVSSFSFINVWYLGFLPIIFVSLHPQRFSGELRQLGYAAFAMAVCLTKPSVILLPLIIYRAVRHKEYLLGGIIVFSVALQALLFLTSNFLESQPPQPHVGLFSKLTNTLLYIGLLELKLFGIQPVNPWLLVIALALLAVIIVAVSKVLGYVKTGLLTLTMMLASYTAIYSPDSAPVFVRVSYEALFYDQLKLQREVMVYFFILLFIFLLLSRLYNIKNNKLPHFGRFLLVAGVIILMAIAVYRPIDTKSANLHVNIEPFRASLKHDEPVCMPIPPTPSWVPHGFSEGPTYGWYYESRGLGTCYRSNYDETIDYKSFKDSIGSSRQVNIKPLGAADKKHKIKAILLPVHVPDSRSHTLVLQNLNTGKIYTAPIEPQEPDDRLAFVAFNLAGEKNQQEYRYALREKGVEDSKISTGRFKDSDLALFAYFLPEDKEARPKESL
jgi:hypothetical protein